MVWGVQKVCHREELLGRPLSRKHAFEIFRGEPKLAPISAVRTIQAHARARVNCECRADMFVCKTLGVRARRLITGDL